MTESTVRLRDLTKFYGSSLGVEGVDLDVEPGTVCGLLGPNGSGKTTILRMMLGLLKITRGSAAVFGIDVASSPPDWRSLVGYLPGELSLYENQTVEQYLSYLSAIRRGEFSTRITELCSRVSLDPTKHIGDLSKGTKQKVGVIQAFMHSPDLLILDEPTSGLDPVGRRELAELLAGLPQTQLVVTHDLPFALQTCPRSMIVSGGKVVADGPTREVLADAELLAANRLELPYGFDVSAL
ncbi:MAG: ABC transporter ATP-binding protein [Ilumatobacteraceae bacterium]